MSTSSVFSSSGGTAVTELDQVILTEAGCAAGVPYTRVTTQTINNVTGLSAVPVVTYSNSAGISTGTIPVGFTLGNCATTYTSMPASISRTEAVTAGNVAAGAESVSFINVGTATATVLGVNLLVGESVSFSAFVDPFTLQRRLLPVIAYVGSATAILHIAEVR